MRKSDLKLSHSQLKYDIPARAENTMLERQEQKLGPLERKKTRSSAQTQE